MNSKLPTIKAGQLLSGRGLFELTGSFASPDALTEAALQLRSLGFREVEAYTPYPVEGLDRVLRPGRRMWLPLVIFLGAVFGAVWGYFIQYWDEALNYLINVGGGPHNSGIVRRWQARSACS